MFNRQYIGVKKEKKGNFLKLGILRSTLKWEDGFFGGFFLLFWVAHTPALKFCKMKFKLFCISKKLKASK